MMAVMVAAASSALAQDDLVKQASKLAASGNLAEAVKVITPALTSDATVDKAAAWNQLSDIQYKIFMVGQTADAENKVKKTTTPYDTAAMNKGITEALLAAVECDKFDVLPNAKGKVKIKYRAENAKRFFMVRPLVINAGLFAYNHGDNDYALRAWKAYLDSGESPLFTGMDMTKDAYRADVAYYAGLVAYQLKNYADAAKYAAIAAQDSSKAKEADEIVIFSQKDQMKTAADSAAYLANLKRMHVKYADESKYYNLLMDYYSKPGRQDEMAKWVEEEIARDPSNKMSWALKGEYLMNNRKWDDAVVAYKKALELDDSFVQVIFNIGVCLNSKAIELKDKLADKNGGLTMVNFNKVKAILSDSKVYLERVKGLDPTQDQVKWAYPLYQIYYSLNEKAKAAEMEKLLNNK